MMRNEAESLVLICASALGLATAIGAQRFVETGEIAVAADGVFAVMSADGSTTREFSSSPLIARLRWDPSRPDSFVCGNAGSQATTTGGAILRKEFLSRDVVQTSSIVPLGRIGRPSEMFWDQGSDHMIVYTLANQLHRVNVRDGSVVDLIVGATPWSGLGAVGFDRATRRLYVVDGGGALHRYDLATGTFALLSQGRAATDLFFDSYHRRLMVMDGSRLEAVDLVRPADSSCRLFGFPGTPASPSSNLMRAFDVDHAGNYVLADFNRVYRIVNRPDCPPGGTSPLLLGSFRFPARPNGTSIFGMDVVGGADLDERYGLRVEPTPSGSVEIELRNAPAGFAFGFLLISFDTSAPVGAGPLLGITPDAVTGLILQTAPAPGDLFAHVGSLPPTLTIPAGLVSQWSGQTWDIMGAALRFPLAVAGATNVVRVTWP